MSQFTQGKIVNIIADRSAYNGTSARIISVNDTGVRVSLFNGRKASFTWVNIDRKLKLADVKAPKQEVVNQVSTDDKQVLAVLFEVDMDDTDDVDNILEVKSLQELEYLLGSLTDPSEVMCDTLEEIKKYAIDHVDTNNRSFSPEGMFIVVGSDVYLVHSERNTVMNKIGA